MILAALAACLLLGAFAFLQHAEFGADPEPDRLQDSPYFANGEFHNLIPTSVLAEGHSALSIMLNDLTKPVDRRQRAATGHTRQAASGSSGSTPFSNPSRSLSVWK